MIEGQATLEKFYQAQSSGEYHWYGVPTDSKEEQDWKNKRKIEILPEDILVPSSNGKYWNRMNRTRAVNIKIPKKHLKVINKKIVLDDKTYEFGHFSSK